MNIYDASIGVSTSGTDDPTRKLYVSAGHHRSSVIIIPDLLYRAVKTYVPEIRHLVKELYYKYRYNYRNRKIFLYYFSSHLMIAFFTL